MRLAFDIETNGFLDVTDRIHCLVMEDVDTGEKWSCASNTLNGRMSIEMGLAVLAKATEIIGHNILKFDVQVIRKLYPDWAFTGTMTDTLVLTRLFYPTLKVKDAEARVARRYTLPPKLTGSHKLEAFGYRLGIMKGEYEGGWETWNKEMQDYCEQDVAVTVALYRRCMTMKETGGPFPETTIQMEHDVQRIVARQERWGFRFDERGAADLFGILSQRREELGNELRQTFKPWWKGGKVKTAKRNHSGHGYLAGSVRTEVSLIEFNPGSGHHIADRLKTLFDWVPGDFTPSGEPKLDDEIIQQLPWPEAKLIALYLTVQKRLGQLAEGKQAWLKAVTALGRIHGGVNTMGAVTYRMTHMGPNIAQVPGLINKKTGEAMAYGAECRSLFLASEGYELVGCDADALELRLLAGYMATWDKGAYIETVLKGEKKLGTDMHSVNCRALGMDPATHRENAKTWFYAFIYGAGDYKLGTILSARGDAKQISAVGARSRASFLKNLPALGKLVEQVKKRVKERGYLIGIDGRRLPVRHGHAALNTLLQSAGAIVMKKALVILDDTLQQVHGLVPGVDYEFCANIHDEWQIDVLPMHSKLVGDEAAHAIALAGEHYAFACPLAGNYSTGTNWAKTH